MKTLATAVLSLLLCSFSLAGPATTPGAIVLADPVLVTGSEPTFGASFAIKGAPTAPNAIGVWGESQTLGVYGNTGNGTGVAGTATDGTGGSFTTYGNGTALKANVPELWHTNGIALDVFGPVKIARNARTRLRVYQPGTNVLVGEFEFEVVVLP